MTSDHFNFEQSMCGNTWNMDVAIQRFININGIQGLYHLMWSKILIEKKKYCTLEVDSF